MEKHTHINEIVLCEDQFGDNLWDVVGKQLEILTKAGEICVVYDDDEGIVIIQHQLRDTHDQYWGEPQPCWLDEKEQDIIDSYREEGKNDQK